MLYEYPKTVQINFSRLGENNDPYQEYTLYATKHRKGHPDELSDMIKVIVINIDYYRKNVL